jgi:hypothetical protein
MGDCIAMILSLLQGDSMQKLHRPFQRAGIFDSVQFFDRSLGHAKIEISVSGKNSSNSLWGHLNSHRTHSVML